MDDEETENPRCAPDPDYIALGPDLSPDHG